MMGSIVGEMLPWYRAARNSKLDLFVSYIIREKKGQVWDTVKGKKRVY